MEWCVSEPTGRSLQPPAKSGDAHSVSIALGLVALVATVYWQVGGFGFVNFDDPRYLTQNALVQRGLSWEGLRAAFTRVQVSNWHPLTMLSLMLDVELFGLDPGRMHLVNAALHAADAVVLFLVLQAMTGRRWRAAVVAALFAVHPLHVESVAWLSERKDVLSTLFWFLAMGAWAAWVRRPGPGRMAAVAAAMVLGLLSKPMVVTLPAALVLLDLWPLRRLGGELPTPARLWPLVREKWPLWLLAAAASVITVVAQQQGGAVSDTMAIPLTARFGNALLSYGAYLLKTVWPAGLAAVYTHPALTPAGLSWPAVALSTGALVLLSAVAAWQWRARPYLAVGWAWYLVTLLPVIGLLQVGLQGMADRYTYVPLVGVFLAITWAVAELVPERAWRRPLLAAVATGAVGASTAIAHRQTATWKDSFALFQHALEVTTDNGLAWRNLGVAWQDARRPDLAIPALRESIRLLPHDARTWLNLAIAHMTAGQIDEADACFRRALEMAPRDPFVWFNVGIAQAMRGDLDGLAATRATLRALDEDLAAELERRLARMGIPR
jgi:protein O-mannosyl-transferase